MSDPKVNIWEGIYQSFSEVPDCKNAFKEDIWKNKLIKRFESDIENFNKDQHITENTITQDYPLPIIVSILASEKKEVSILDFGGGLGTTFIQTLANIPKPTQNKINYHIVEFKDTCELGNSKYKDFDNIHFHDKIPSIKKFDIIHIGSALQYIDDWIGLIESFNLIEHQYLVFSDLMAGDIPTFVSTQEYYGKKLKTRFWNVTEFSKDVEKIGYKEIFHTLYLGTFFGKPGPLPMENLPKTHQLKHACHIIFKR